MQQNNNHSCNELKSNDTNNFITNSDVTNTNTKNKNGNNNNNNSFKPLNQQQQKTHNNLDWNNISEFTTNDHNHNHNHNSDISSKLGSLMHHDLVNNANTNNNNHEINNHLFNSTHDLINDQPTSNNPNNNNNNSSSYISNCGDNMFGSFNFFNDEIKLEI
jgi:hypothetical protein